MWPRRCLPRTGRLCKWVSLAEPARPLTWLVPLPLPQLVTRAACAWALRRGRSERVAHAALLHGAWRWEPSRALRYRLLLRLALSPGDLDADADPEPAFTYVRTLCQVALQPRPGPGDRFSTVYRRTYVTRSE